MKITIIGSGYVGLVSAACFAEIGHSVTCLDVNKQKINKLKKLSLPIYEPYLQDLVTKNYRSSKIQFTSSYRVGCKNNIIFLCIDTPSKKDGSPNLTNLNSALNSIAKNLLTDSIVITKSTVPLGTNNYIHNKLLRLTQNKKINIEVCSNPEFLREGSAVEDFFNAARIIIGTRSENGKQIMTKVYSPMKKRVKKIIFMSPESAELTKYAANAFLASKISFINEMSQIAEAFDANINEIREGIGTDPRIGKEFLFAGLGFGGSCLPKDLRALSFQEKQIGLKNSIVSEALSINNNQLDLFLRKIFSVYSPSQLKKKNIVIWGLSFKPKTDDIREAPAIELVKRLAGKVRHISTYDPKALTKAKKELSNFKNISFHKEKYSSFKSSHCLMICTEWEEFFSPEISKLLTLKDGQIFDGRNIIDPLTMDAAGLHYHGIGL